MPVTAAELNQKLLEELLAIQIKAETTMLEKVAKRVKRGITTPGWNEQKLSDVQLLQKEILKILNDANKLNKSYIQKSILKAYETAGNKVNKTLLVKPQTLMNDLIPLHLQHMILETQNAISGTSFQILRNTMDIYREVISETTTGLLIGTDTRQQVAQQALNNFAAKGVSGFTDKIGRKWELASYVEMAIRTSNSRAALQGHVDRSLELGQDLILVSGHAATCPICAPWGNKVISITGKTPGYPTLAMAKEAGLFHPNCKHTLTVWFPDLEGNQEHLEEYTQEPDIEKYNAIQKQRYNERKIREWKRIEAVALTPEAKQKANNKILEWQAIQRQHINEYGLRRKYIREGIKNRTGSATKASVKPDISKIYKPMAKIESIPEVNVGLQKIMLNLSAGPVEVNLEELLNKPNQIKKFFLKFNTELDMEQINKIINNEEEVNKILTDLYKEAYNKKYNINIEKPIVKQDVEDDIKIINNEQKIKKYKIKHLQEADYNLDLEFAETTFEDIFYKDYIFQGLKNDVENNGAKAYIRTNEDGAITSAMSLLEVGKDKLDLTYLVSNEKGGGRNAIMQAAQIAKEKDKYLYIGTDDKDARKFYHALGLDQVEGGNIYYNYTIPKDRLDELIEYGKLLTKKEKKQIKFK